MFSKKLIMVAVLATACATASGAIPLQVSGSVGDVSFPAVDRSYLPQGDFVNVENLRQMKTGLNKDQVRLLLGNPHFREGIFGSDEWNYIFNFRTGVGEEYITCQYQVRYDKASTGYQARSMHWDGPACLELVNAPAQAPVTTPAAPVERIQLSADVLFPFARSAMADILPPGRAELDALVTRLAQADVMRVDVVGHTDRIGSDADNQALSERRAASVREYLVAAGVPAAQAHAQGRGKRQPVNDCSDALPRPELIACLAPNRRVEIVVNGSAP